MLIRKTSILDGQLFGRHGLDRMTAFLAELREKLIQDPTFMIYTRETDRMLFSFRTNIIIFDYNDRINHSTIGSSEKMLTRECQKL